MDRKIYKFAFTADKPNSWVCPTCEIGLLTIRKEEFQSEELRDSKRAHAHDAWDPDWIEYTYSCLLHCNNSKCCEVVASTGKGSVDWDVEDDADGVPQQVYLDFYKPLFFHPHLKIIPIPSEAPEEVRDALYESFKLFFCSPTAALNHVRRAIEELLTALKVKRFSTSNGKRRPLPLHNRIDMLPSKYTPVKELLTACKWLGNAGSHSGSHVTLDDVMDAYELVELILAELFDLRRKNAQALAKQVNKAKGPKK